MKWGTTATIEAGTAASMESTALTRLSSRWRWLLLPAMGILAVYVALAIDTKVEGYFLSIRLPGVVRDLLNVAEVFGNGFGVVLVVLLIVVLDPARHVATLRLVWCSLGAGVLADLVKLLVSRARPRAINLDLANPWDTFGPLMPFLQGGSPAQSFPSAHTATAAGLAVGLAALYPRGRYLFLTLAIGVAVQRMMVGAHYPSDVLVGAAIGTLWASYCQPGMRLGNWIGRWEDWFAAKMLAAKSDNPPATLKFPLVGPAARAADAEMQEAA